MRDGAAATAEGLARAVGVAGACLATALVATWPLAEHPATRIPLGTEHEATVPIFSLWNLWWVADRIPHAFVGFLNAPFFYPNTGVTTYSEPMPLLGALVAPLWWLGAPPAVTYNVALLGVLTLNGVFVYRLARALDVPPLAAVTAGVAGVALPFAAAVLGVLPNLALFGMLWTLDGLVRFGRSGSTRAAAWAAAGLLATFLTFEQYALFFAPFALVAGIVALSLHAFRRDAVVRLAAAGAVGAALVLPFAVHVARMHARLGLRRPAELVQALSARPGDFLSRPETALVHAPGLATTDTGGLFPGLVLLALALGGFVSALRDPGRRRWALYLGGAAVAAFLLALGLNLHVLGWRPFASLRADVPGYDEVRSPYRFDALVDIHLAALAALGLGRLRVATVPRAAAVVVAVGALAVAENLSLPAPLIHVPTSARTAWTAWLRDQPPGTVVVHVPFPAGFAASDYAIESWRLFAQTNHHKPLVNGYSGYFPVVRTPDRVYPAYAAFQLTMAREFPSYPLLCVLAKDIGANVVVVDRPWLRSHRAQVRRWKAFLRPAYADGAVGIYALRVPAGSCRRRA
jgi:hypothetical protein